MGHIAIFGNDLEALDRFDVANYVVEEDGAVFLDPAGAGQLRSVFGCAAEGSSPWQFVVWSAIGIRL